MTYSTLIEKELINSQFLVVIRPRRRVTSWVFVSGTTWTNVFDYGNAYGVKLNGSTLAFTYVSGVITISTATNPNTAFTVVTYELYVGTNDAHWYSNPLSTSSTEVYFEPMVAVSPQLKQTAKDILFGFIPVQTSSITLNNVTGFMNRHVYDSSFHNAQINLYHWLGDALDVANIKLLMSGLASQVSFSDTTCTLNIFSSLDLLDRTFIPPVGDDAYWPVTEWPDSDIEYSGRPVRYCYGMVDGHPLINLEPDAGNTSTDNRKWGVCITGNSTPWTHASTITGTGTNDGIVQTIPVTSANGFNIGDVVKFYRTDASSSYSRVSSISGNTLTVRPYTGVNAGAFGAATCTKYQIGYVKYLQAGWEYTLYPDRDFTINIETNSKILWIELASNAEPNAGGTDPSDIIRLGEATLYARVYGKQNDVTVNANPIGGNSVRTNNMANASPVIVDLLQDQLGITDSEINESAFTAFETVAHDIGIMIPREFDEVYPTVKEVVSDILTTEMAKLYIDADGKFAIKALAPITTTTYDTSDDEILRSSFNYNFNYSELLSDFIVVWREMEQTFAESDIAGTNGPEWLIDNVTSTSSVATYLHDVRKQKTFHSLHIHETDAQEYADRLSYVFGDRFGTATISLKNRFLETGLGDDYQVSRVSMPGYELDLDLERSRNFAVIDAVRSLSEVTIQLDDQKGLEDNAGVW